MDVLSGVKKKHRQEKNASALRFACVRGAFAGMGNERPASDTSVAELTVY